MNYTENDIRYFFELFRVYGTKPYSSNTYISPNALIGVIKDPNEYDVSRMLMNCMAYYLHLDFSDANTLPSSHPVELLFPHLEHLP